MENGAGCATSELLQLNSLTELFRWYRLNLVEPEIRDSGGYRVRLLDFDFVHLIKLINKYGKRIELVCVASWTQHKGTTNSAKVDTSATSTQPLLVARGGLHAVIFCDGK